MGQQIAHRDLAREVRIAQLEPRQVLRDRVVPGELLLVHEHADERRRHRFGRRANREQRVVVHRPGLPSSRTP